MSRRQMPDYAGLREYRKARETGRYVGLYDGEAAGMDTEGGRWQTVCEEHGGIVSHQTLSLARYHLSNPMGWCEMCMEVGPKLCDCMTEDPGDGYGERVVTHSGDCSLHPEPQGA